MTDSDWIRMPLSGEGLKASFSVSAFLCEP